MITMDVVVGIIADKDSVLLSLRPAGKPYANYWEFPGGKVNSGETAYDALVRELAEELGIQVGGADELFSHQHAYVDRLVNLSVWQITQYTGVPQGLENQELAWFRWDELTNLRLLAANYTIINKAKHLILTKTH